PWGFGMKVSVHILGPPLQWLIVLRKICRFPLILSIRSISDPGISLGSLWKSAALRRWEFDAITCFLFQGKFINHLGYQSSPAGLMAGADARSIVAMEILIKRHVVTPVRVRLEFFICAKHRTASLCVTLKGRDQAAADLVCDFVQVQHTSRAGGALYAK